MKEYGNPEKTRAVFRLSGLSAPIQYGVHNNNLTNLRRGLVERVFNVETPDGLAPPPRPAPGHIGTKLKDFKDRLLSHMKMAAPCTLDQFVQLYAGDRRQKVYAAAVEDLKLREVCQQDAYLTTFVKAEKINLTKKSDPAPRVIQPRTPRYNSEVGCYVKQLEKRLYRGMAEVFGETTVLKGYNAADSGKLLREKWERYRDPVAVGLDASRFDQHVSAEALEWEHSVYEACFYPSDRKKLRRLLQWQVNNRGTARASDGHIKYKVRGCRMSGDMNTALGNCLLMCAMVWTYLQEKGVMGSLANNGDDCVVIMERKDLSKFSCGLAEWFLEMGFTMKVESPVDIFEKIEFCQTHPIWHPDGWLMCRDGLVAMAKDCHTVLPLKEGKFAQGWATAIGECGLALSGGVPIFQAFYSRLLLAGGGVHMGKHPALESGFARLASGMQRRVRPVMDETRVSFWEAFGILPSQQERLEQMIAGAPLDLGLALHRETTQDFTFLQAI